MSKKRGAGEGSIVKKVGWTVDGFGNSEEK